MSFIEKLKSAKTKIVDSIKILQVDDDIRDARLEVCKSCEHLSYHVCTQCGCFVQAKAALISAKCPLNKW